MNDYMLTADITWIIYQYCWPWYDWYVSRV